MGSEQFDIMSAIPGEHVEDFAARMVVASYERNTVILGEHNDHTLECRPGMTREQVMAPWHLAQRRSYLGVTDGR